MSENGHPPGDEAVVPATFLGRAAIGIEKFIKPIYTWLGYAGAAVLALVTIAMIYSAIGRYLKHPLDGSGDITELGFLMMLALALGIEHMGHEKMTVEAVVNMFPKKLQAWLQPFIFFLVVVMLVIAVWQLIKYGVEIQGRGEKTPGTMHLLRYPFVYLISFGVMTLIPTYLARFLSSIDRLVKR